MSRARTCCIGFIYGLIVVLLVDVHTNHNTAQGCILQCQFLANAMPRASDLREILLKLSRIYHTQMALTRTVSPLTSFNSLLIKIETDE